MRLAISNIAWDAVEDSAVERLLHRYEVNAIDVAPGKYFPNPALATDADVTRVFDWWTTRGIEITGMQALLFGTTGLNVFGSKESQINLLSHLTDICRIGSGLGAKYLVFGSPKNRDRSGMNDDETSEVALSFFQRLGNIAQTYGVSICLEPNPPCYGANFMTTSAETARIVKQISHPAIKMQFDTGALAINEEDPLSVLEDCAAFIGHVHASEPNLLPLGDSNTDHNRIAIALNKALPNHVVSIEMLATQNEPHIKSIERAIKTAIHYYRDK
ncbi:Inosose dehydratase [Legionella santicrucis]|uniref:Inosose dehydratase n=1 Tax=Legionella santicrucis TaxID=45074 RepID=A0A0W0Z3J3_9GAMM|nr:TIM barrel protein [Legionella santicrucis]KTD63705.1 Inosose dehydratase [Legionella santicrucis]